MQQTSVLTIEKIKEVVSDIAQEYEVNKIFLFGSYARGEETVKSDIDLRIDMEQTEGLEFWGIWQDLEDNLGKKIDLLKDRDIPDNLRQNIMMYEVLIYDSFLKR